MIVSANAKATLRGIALAVLLASGGLAAPGTARAAEKWQELVEAAGYAYEAHRPVQAQQLLEEAIGHTKPDTGPRAAVLNNLAIVLEANGLMDAAETLYGQVIGIWAKVLGPGHQNVARTLGNLGDLHHRRNQMDEALEAYEVAIASIEQAQGADATQVRRALYENYSRVLYDLGRNEDAKAARLKAFPPGN